MLSSCTKIILKVLCNYFENNLIQLSNIWSYPSPYDNTSLSYLTDL